MTPSCARCGNCRRVARTTGRGWVSLRALRRRGSALFNLQCCGRGRGPGDSEYFQPDAVNKHFGKIDERGRQRGGLFTWCKTPLLFRWLKRVQDGWN